MKKNNTLWLLLLALSSLFAACKKDAPQDELSKLPPATQTGANTFGCLVNGKAWIKQSSCLFLCDPAFKISYDAGFGGTLMLKSRYESSALNISQRIVLSFDSTNYRTVFNFLKDHTGFIYDNDNIPVPCEYINSNDNSVFTTGKISLSRYDLTNGIISGTFDFTLKKAGCETIAVTNGRFDGKLF